MTDIPSASDLDQFLGQIEAKVRQSDETVETAAERVSAENQRRMGRDRSWIAITIIVTYALAVGGAILFILISAPACDSTDAAGCTTIVGEWKTQAELLQNLIVTAVLPIVTLMLGFYFGTETTRSATEGSE